MKKLALFLFGLCSLAAVSMSAGINSAQSDPTWQAPCTPDTICAPAPCYPAPCAPDTVCAPAPCTPAPCGC
ncbi:MAG: hypothetical protein J1F16_02495 [Muribaculaceae bacterium]|nr:hypothetical protein [Muribaculaceae bacterium]